ncbi:sensor histidine kinase [Mastigocoleus testarum]|uniref:histidine kinase n=1 Tax=Mastigocoleus testarum BC008 TaxID=371196 RepID=A0A0V7ZGK9_9CYAN|nr:ATP-binding protein [Mastigocoleus testarum]KST63683.1 histidine kinase [Mastigocoleus testarum BC008]KST63775.1 histidine kinase [Mastigocoleus testarum BC008]
MTHKSFLVRWFYNLPIRRKQLTGLFASEIISTIGLVGVGAILIVTGGQSILFHQAKSELIVSQMSYDIKINQMGFGFRGQSDNIAIINALKESKGSRNLNPSLQKQVKQILQNEITAREIEDAVLVGKDLRVIVNGKTDKSGEIYNPNNLVSKVLESNTQIKTTEIINEKELYQRDLPLPSEVKGEDILIRYTVTPVQDPKTGEVLGALLSGDVINHQSQIVKQILNATGGGYSAIYLHQSTGKFSLVTAALERRQHRENRDKNLNQRNEKYYNKYRFNVPLENNFLLKLAVEKPGQVATTRLKVGNNTYTIAAQSINNFAKQPVAVLVRGTPERDLNLLLRDNLFVQGVVAIIALAIDIGLAILLGRAIVYPIKCLQKAAQDFSTGDLQARAEVIAQDEIGELAHSFNLMVEQIARRDRTILQQMQQLQGTLEQLQNTQNQLIQTEKMSGLGQMVAGIAHEINNPVNFIYGNLDYAKEYTQNLIELLQIYQIKYPEPDSTIKAKVEAIDVDFLQKDLPKLLNSMEVGSERIKEIVNSLRNFSRVDEAEFKAVNIHEGIDNTLIILANRLKENIDRPEIDVIKEYGNIPLVECYAGQINQVFMNLISNAIDALNEHTINVHSPKIWIYTERLKSNWIVIKIKDNGQGIDREVSSKLFEPFFTTKPVGKGTGLGLSISYQIVVEKHHGSISCNSNLGEGTEFVVKIPIQQTIEL